VALVARADDAADLREEASDRPQQRLALDRVGVDDPALLGGEGAGLVDDLGRDLDLPDVVEKRGEFRLAPLALVQRSPGRTRSAARFNSRFA